MSVGDSIEVIIPVFAGQLLGVVPAGAKGVVAKIINDSEVWVKFESGDKIKFSTWEIKLIDK